MPNTHFLSTENIARAQRSNARWAERLGWGSREAEIARAIRAGKRSFVRAVARWQARHGLKPDGILGPQTWAALQRELASPTSLPVPHGFDEVIQTFGDPRPLLGADGTITPENEKIWIRRTLARGTLPFPIPIPGGGVKQRFLAHHLLVGVFEATFREIARRGLRGEVASWGGIYNFRPIRGRRRLSLHAFGAAIDLNPETNRLGTEGDLSPAIVEVFEHFGFVWGGRFRRRDPMHFQYARGC
jgi:hypothetical protein